MPLELRDVRHRYGESPMVLEGIDLQVGAGESLAIVAPSGSGKTTLLSILGGLLRPSGGSVHLDGEPVGSGGVPVGTVAWVFQTINLFGRRTARDNVAIGSLSLGHDNRTARSQAERALARVGLEDYGHRRANTLSGGEAQRVGIARALAGRPRYLLADEPTGQLDRSTSEVVAEALFSARGSETSIVVATHDLSIASRCERILAVVSGRLQEQ